MKFGYAITYVQNVRQTIDFYVKAFGFKEKFVTPENDYGELLSGETTLAFGSVGLGESNFEKGIVQISEVKGNVGIEIVFVSSDIEKDFDLAVKAGAELIEPIQQKPWGQKVGYLKDINGLLVEICTSVESQDEN